MKLSFLPYISKQEFYAWFYCIFTLFIFTLKINSYWNCGNYMSMIFEMNIICSKLKLKVYKNWDDSNL